MKDNGLPPGIPSHPEQIYKKEWKDWPDFLGTKVFGSSYGRYRDFQDAIDFVRKLKLFGSIGWYEYCKSGKKPDDIPSHPEKVYKKEWKDWPYWTGIDARKTKFRKLRSFKEARSFVHSLKLKNASEWGEWKKTGKKPADLPATPNLVYKSEWKGMGDWLGTYQIPRRKSSFRIFSDARKFVRMLRLKSSQEWYEWKKSPNRPNDIPTNPNVTYKGEWKGMGDWLGVVLIAKQNMRYSSFDDARQHVHSLNLKTTKEWYDWLKTKDRPRDIPTNPQKIYKDEWKGIFDWLGIEEKSWSVKKIKNLLKDLIKSGIIYQWNEAVLYSFLLRKGLLNLGEGNRHNAFFKNLLKALKTPAGRDAVEDYVNSSYEEPPNFSKIVELNELPDTESEIGLASSDEIIELLDDTDPLDYADVVSVADILRHTDALESISIDEEAMRFYVNYSVCTSIGGVT